MREKIGGVHWDDWNHWDHSDLILLFEWVNAESIRLIGEGNIFSYELLQKSCAKIIRFFSDMRMVSVQRPQSKDEEYVYEWVYARLCNIDLGIRHQHINEEESILDSICLLATFYDENKDFFSTNFFACSDKISYIPKLFKLPFNES